MGSSFSAALYLALLSSDVFCSAELDRMLVTQDAYGLPRAPKDAVLVQYFSRDLLGADVAYAKYVSSFRPAVGFSRDGETVLDHLGKPVAVKWPKPVKPDPVALGDEVQLGSLEDAIQYHARGWKELARVTFRNWQAEYHDLRPEDYLRYNAWFHWKQRLQHDPDMPLATVAKYLKLIHPQLDSYEGDDREKLLAALELSLKPRNSLPGSDEALIDALIEARGKGPRKPWSMDGLRSDPHYQAMVRRGLDAVPSLIAHLGDDRLTRSYLRPSGGKELRVKDVVFDILMQLHGGPFPFDGGRGVLDNGVPKDLLTVIGNWYADAHKLGEEKYVLSRIVGEDKDDSDFRPGLLWLLAEKYPQRLPEVFRKSIDARKDHARYAWLYAKAITEAAIPDADKRKALEYAAKQGERTVRAAGIYYLRRFDPKLAKERLLQGLAELPANAGDLEDAGLAFIVAEGSDPDEWRALAGAVRRANATGEITLVCAVLCAKAPEGRLHRLAFLLEYLTDDLSADAREDRLTQSEARHIATGQVAALRRIETKPYPMDWAADSQWGELRELVKEELWP